MQRKTFQKSILSLLIMALLVTGIPISSFAEDRDENSRENLMKQVEQKADKLLAMDDLSSRNRLTDYEMNTDLDETNWYQVWEEAQRYKDKARFCTVNELKNALNDMSYTEKLYAYPVSHDLSKDGFYSGSYEIRNLIKIGGGHNQNLYTKGDVNNEIKSLFDGKVRIIKSGNQYDVRLDVDRTKVKSIESVYMNYIMAKPVSLDYQQADPTQSEANARIAFTVSVPGELTGEELAVTSLKYTDNAGVEHEIGPFGIFIKYGNLVQDESYVLPDYYNSIRSNAMMMQTNLQPLLSADEDAKYINNEQKATIKKVLDDLDTFMNLPEKELTYSKYLEIVNPAMDIEDSITLKKALERKLNFEISDLSNGIYTPERYTEKSIKDLENYYKEAKAKLPNLSLKDTVAETTKYKFATAFYLRHNMTDLEETIKLAREKMKSGDSYTTGSYGRLLTALSNAEDWVKKNQDYCYTEDSKDSTKTYNKALKDAINKLEKDNTAKPTKKEYTVNVRFLDNNNHEKESMANVCLIGRAKLTEENGASKLVLNLKPMYRNGNAAGVISQLYTYKNDGDKVKGNVLEKDNVNINGTEVKFPTAIEIGVDGKTKRIKINLNIDVAGQGAHDHDVILEIDYDNKTDGFNPAESVNKDDLNNAINFYNSNAWMESISVIKAKNLEKFNSALEEAIQIKTDDKATQKQVNSALKNLIKEGDRVNTIVIQFRACEQAAGDYRSDLASKKFTKESMNAIKERIVEGQAILAKEEITDSDIQRLIAIDFINLYEMRRYDTSGIKEAIENANKKLDEGKEFTAESVQALKDAIKTAQEYIIKASETAFVADERADHIKRINEKISALIAKENDPDSNLKQKKTRIAGSDRYETSTKIADKLKEKLNVEKFDSIVIANGDNFADALSATYLAKVKKAPILIVNKWSADYISNYVKNNTSKNPDIYVIGGEDVVSKEIADKMPGKKHRLEGDTRFETNLEVLKASGAKNEDIALCNAYSFADALSASAAGKPIMLVDKKLSDAQMTYLKKLNFKKFYLIGGSDVVSRNVENAVSKLGDIERLAGDDRYGTSKAIAEKFFAGKHKNAYVTYGLNFPDGLCAGVLCDADNSALLLASNKNMNEASEYVSKAGVLNCTILGGDDLISESAADMLFKK